MKKLGTLLLAVLFSGIIFTSCVDAQADEIYDQVVPEKSQDGNTQGGTESPGPLGP